MPYKDPKKNKAYWKKYKKEHPEMYRTSSREWARKNRLHYLQQRYGITPEEYNALLLEQGCLCAICQKPEKRKLYGKPCQLSVDHNHETGKNRGLLCSNCNTAIGLLQEDILIFQAAVEYLKKWIR